MNSGPTARRLPSVMQPIQYSELHSMTISGVKPPCALIHARKMKEHHGTGIELPVHDRSP